MERGAPALPCPAPAMTNWETARYSRDRCCGASELLNQRPRQRQQWHWHTFPGRPLPSLPTAPLASPGATRVPSFAMQPRVSCPPLALVWLLGVPLSSPPRDLLGYPRAVGATGRGLGDREASRGWAGECEGREPGSLFPPAFPSGVGWGARGRAYPHPQPTPTQPYRSPPRRRPALPVCAPASARPRRLGRECRKGAGFTDALFCSPDPNSHSSPALPAALYSPVLGLLRGFLPAPPRSLTPPSSPPLPLPLPLDRTSTLR